jgi:hypothetical protein
MRCESVIGEILLNVPAAIDQASGVDLTGINAKRAVEIENKMTTPKDHPHCLIFGVNELLLGSSF